MRRSEIRADRLLASSKCDLRRPSPIRFCQSDRERKTAAGDVTEARKSQASCQYVTAPWHCPRTAVEPAVPIVRGYRPRLRPPDPPHSASCEGPISVILLKGRTVIAGQCPLSGYYCLRFAQLSR